MSLNERMNKLNKKASLTSEELEQVTGGTSIWNCRFDIGRIKYETTLFWRSDGSHPLMQLAQGTMVMVYETVSGFSRVSGAEDARSCLGYVEADAIEITK